MENFMVSRIYSCTEVWWLLWDRVLRPSILEDMLNNYLQAGENDQQAKPAAIAILVKTVRSKMKKR
jgi:hypothetical protein